MRDGAFVTLPLGAVDLARRRISQLPELGVLTKNSKAAITSLFPIAPLLAIVEEWDSFVRSQSDDPHLAWYTRLRWDGTEIDITDLIEPGRSWTGRVNALREGLKEICRLAGVEYKSPHKIRHGHGVYGIKRAKTMAELKALSQNMMHENISTTDGIYGNLVEDDVASILATFTPD
jgi:integrase